MSRIGKNPVLLPAGVTAAVNGRTVSVQGPKGTLDLNVPEAVAVSWQDNTLVVSQTAATRDARARHGLVRTLLANMVEGVERGFQKQLQIEGVGFKAQLDGRNLLLSLGFASPKIFKIPEGVTVGEQGGTRLTVEGIDKQKVGDVAARIRGYFPAEPYKGKGIRYVGEQVRRKVGKTVA